MHCPSVKSDAEHCVLTALSLPQGTISVGVDATDLFDRYDEEYEDVSGSGFPQIEINKMHISQSIEVKHKHLCVQPEVMRRSAGAAG